VLFARAGALPADPGGVRAFNIADPAVAFAGDAIGVWRAHYGASAVLVRPDRYVFGTGEPKQLIEAWSR
jgi:3-(3-hydroxy-phenyl)propionate hydroxylase